MTFYQYSHADADTFVATLNTYNISNHRIIAIVHDGTNFVCFYWN